MAKQFQWKEKFRQLGNLSFRSRWILVTTFLWGIFAHGFMLSHKISFHDDTFTPFYLGGTYGLGRWLLGVFGKIFNMLGGNYTLPMFNGLMAIACIGVAACLIAALLELQRPVSWTLLSGIMVSLPVVAGLFGFMFTAFLYMLAMLLAVLGVYILCGGLRLPRGAEYVVSIGVLCLSMGIYQSYYPLAISLVVVFLLKQVLDENFPDWTSWWREGLRSLTALLFAVAAYWGMNRIFLKIMRVSLADYAQLDVFGVINVQTYLQRIGLAYMKFFCPNPEDAYNLFPLVMLGMQKLLLLFGGCLLLRELWKQEGRKVLQSVFLLIWLPLSVNFILVLTAEGSVHTLMMYSWCAWFALLIWLGERNRESSKVLSGGLALALLCVSLWYSRYDNICYLKEEYLQSRAISYFTTLITRIEMTPGYRDTYPVVYVNRNEKKDENLTINPEFQNIKIVPYREESLINDYAWSHFMAMWCGYSPTELDSSDFENLEAVKGMPSYPDDGSIQVLNQVVIVKF